MTDASPQPQTLPPHLAAHGLPSTVTDDRARLIEMCAWIATLRAEHDSLQARLNGLILHQHGDALGQMDRMAAEIADADAAIAQMAAAHPEWFAQSETLQSRFGVLKRTTGKTLNISDEDKTVEAIYALTDVDPVSLLHTACRPNKEALEKLSDEELLALGVQRVRTTKYTFTPKPLTPAREPEKKPRRTKALAAAPQEQEVAHA